MIIFTLLGVIASVFQLVILREFVFSIAKNELSFILAIGFWIIACSLGSMIKIPAKLRSFTIILLNSISFILSITLIHLAKSLTGLRYYEATGLGFILISSILLILPCAAATGITFSYFVKEHQKKHPLDKYGYAKFFAYEAIGFCLGGVIMTFLLADYSNPFIFSGLALLLLPTIKSKPKKLTACGIIAILSAFLILNFNQILSKEFNNSQILINIGSNYGPVIAAKKDNITSVFSAGSLLATSEDRILAEEFIHMSMAALKPQETKDILFIGPTLSGQIREIKKYKLNSLDCLQINPVISRLEKANMPGGIIIPANFIVDDPLVFLKAATKRYDAILMNMPPPSNLALNRYYTLEFFRLVKEHLKPQGIFTFQIPSKREILSPQFIKFDSSIINSLDRAFATNRFIVPSDSMLIIAKNQGEISSDELIANLKAAKILTQFFTIYHFKDYLDASIRYYVESALDKKVEANTALNPSAFLNYLLLEQIKFYPELKIEPQNLRLAIYAGIILFAAVIILLRPKLNRAFYLLNAGIVGFNSIGLSAVIFALFQQYYGGLFWKLGLLVALFMAGVSSGTFAWNKLLSKINFTPALFSGYYLTWAAAILPLFFGVKNYCPEIIFYIYAFICGALTGGGYPTLSQSLLINKFDKKKIAILIYSQDLIGAFFGTIAFSLLLIPFLGISSSLATLIIINAIFSLMNLRN